MTQDVLGHYCQMNLAEHDGPKAQRHLKNNPNPIFFGQVRDALAYLHEPEKTAPVTALYMSDMARAESWAEPGPNNWIEASLAYFVVASDAIGGMGAPEIVPFSTTEDASAFQAKHGGQILRLDAIQPEDVLGAIDRNASQSAEEDHS